ncbi:MAG: DUF192 domain-containing protein [Candidatus Pacebacteria bacterium]|nr:DUF192 domain-containing protein [Candidatus Paceibacterota bacterium]
MKIPEWLKTTLSVILLALIFVAYFLTHTPEKKEPESEYRYPITNVLTFNHTVLVGETEVQAAFATIPEETERGLSNSVPLQPNEGMLFVFDEPGRTPFWMKDMNYSIDIIWIDENKKVIDITRDLSPSSFPNVYPPKEPALYALEVPAGFAAAHDVIVGTDVSF